jgi:hypothetical protein
MDIHVDGNLSLNNCKFGDFVDRIFPIELKIKDTTCTARSASCLDLHLSEGWLRMKLYDKGVDNKYAVNQKLEHFDDISFRELFWLNQSGFLQNKICPFLA